MSFTNTGYHVCTAGGGWALGLLLGSTGKEALALFKHHFIMSRIFYERL